MARTEKGIRASFQDSTRGKFIELAERRALAVEFRKAGHSYPEVVELVKQAAADRGYKVPKSYNRGMAYKDVTAIMEEYNKRALADVAEYRTLQMTRYESLLQTLWPQVANLDYKAIDRILTVMAAINKMLGLNEPERFEIKARGTGEAKVVRSEVRITQDSRGKIVDVKYSDLPKDMPVEEDPDVIEGAYKDG